MCDLSSKVDLMLSCLEDKKHSVKTIVLMEKPSVELVSRAKRSGIDVISVEEMEVSTPSKKTLPPVNKPHVNKQPEYRIRLTYEIFKPLKFAVVLHFHSPKKQDFDIVIMHHRNFDLTS